MRRYLVNLMISAGLLAGAHHAKASTAEPLEPVTITTTSADTIPSTTIQTNSSPKKVLIFGFKPFSDTHNVSELVLEKLNLDSLEGIEIYKEVLPADKAALTQIFKEKTGQIEPDIILGVGEVNWEKDSTLAKLTVAELTAESSIKLEVTSNPRDSTENMQISGFNLEELQNQLTECGVTADLSYYPGDGPCNELYALALKYMQEHRQNGNALFLHLDDMIMSSSRDDYTGLVNNYAKACAKTVQWTASR